MPNIQINTDGKIEETTILIDGKNITENEKITNIYMSASASYISQYSGETYPGRVYVSYDKVNDDGVIESYSIIGGSNDRSKTGIGAGEIKSSDSVVRYINQAQDDIVTKLTDNIVNFANKNNVKVPKKEVLLTRTEQSLRDTCDDMGIKLD